tara:strand:- start:330 stop:578 length:249 start_codon:yes stop_codon:yes gene_type:complete
MKDSLTIELEKDTYIEVHYECWGEGSFVDYDQPKDPSGHEIQLIELHIKEHVIDITNIADDLSSGLGWSSLERTVEENILNK